MLIEGKTCTQKDFETDLFKQITKGIKHKFVYHRKLWEFVSIIDTLQKLNLLKENIKGLGFAVGQEPLSSYFIKQGCEIIASDYMIKDSIWNNENQVAYKINDLNTYGIINFELLIKKLAIRNVDMNNIPDDLKQSQFDFLWSSCAIEHLGSIEKGLEYIVNSINCLKPGGYAIHTTEYNWSSNDDTVFKGSYVIFRKKDFEKLKELLDKKAILYPIIYDYGKMEYDNYVDKSPYRNDIHLKLLIEKYISTSILIIIQRIS